MSEELKGGLSLEEENQEPESRDGAYWWFVNLFDPGSARVHLEEMENIPAEKYDGFVATLNKEDNRKIQEIRSYGIRSGDDKQYIQVLAQGFSEFMKNNSQ